MIVIVVVTIVGQIRHRSPRPSRTRISLNRFVCHVARLKFAVARVGEGLSVVYIYERRHFYRKRCGSRRDPINDRDLKPALWAGCSNFAFFSS